MTEQQMITDGWRRCAVGQRTTQQCGLVEEARTQERARIRGMVQAELDGWLKHFTKEEIFRDSFEDGCISTLIEVLALIDKDTSHE